MAPRARVPGPAGLTRKLRQATLVLAVNLLLLLVGLLALELGFGYWLHPDPLARLRVKRNQDAVLDASQLYPSSQQVHYRRDRYGLRGSYPSPDRIDVLTLGGSTTDQLYLTEGQTWQDVMARESGLVVVNAGVDGQSSYGHVQAFANWFPYIPGLKVRYFLFYVGYNDLFVEPGWATDRVAADSWAGWLHSRSALLQLATTLAGWARARQTQIGHGACRLEPAEATREPLLRQPASQLFQERLARYRANLEQLVTGSRTLGGEAILVTQSCRWYKEHQGTPVGNRQTLFIDGHTLNGLDVRDLLEALNEVARQVAREQRALLLDVAREVSWEDEDFYDLAHNTPRGAEKLGRYLARQLTRQLQVTRPVGGRMRPRP